MVQKRALIGILLASVLLSTTILPVSAALDASSQAQEGPNLLQNPGFEEGPYLYNNIGELKLPNSWEPWYVDEGDQDPAWKNPRPEYNMCGEPIRVRSGSYSLQYGKRWSTHWAGARQRVGGITPGSRVRFTIWGYMYAHPPEWSPDQQPGNLHMRIGIDPTGGTDPFAGHIVWSPEASPLALGTGSGAPWHQFVVEAVAGADAVTVFVYSNPESPMDALAVQWDDASLTLLEPPTQTPPPPPPTATYGPSPTPRSTPTPRPDGAIVHVVQSGETLFGIALMYGVDINQLRQLNAGSIGEGDMIWPGQELVISLPTQTLTPTPLPAPPTPEPTPGPEGSGAEGGTGGASVCVLAYHDRNGDTFRDEATEELLPNAEFTLADASGVIARYTSDGLSEPYCFTGLAPGTYRVILSPPPGYTHNGPAEWAVPLTAEGESLNISFGNVRSEGAINPVETGEPYPVGEEENDQPSSSNFGRVFSVLAKASGVLVLLLAVGMAVLFVLNRRRM